MSKEKQIEIKVVTYKEERLNYFTALYEKAKNKFDRLFKKHKDAPYLSDEFKNMSDAGHEAEFLGDVVKMLKQSEWISVGKPPEVYRDEYGELIPFLVCCKGTVYPFRAVYDGTNWGDGIGRLKVTHWMPLPEPPKMKGGAE